MKSIITSIIVLFTTLVHSQNFEIYVSDAGNFTSPPWQILKFDQNGQNPVVFINNNVNWPQDIFFMEDSNMVLISSLSSGRITRHNATTGAFISDFALGISGPTRMKVGPDGYLYVLQWGGNGNVLRYNLNGTFVDEFTTVGVPTSIGIDWDTAGNLYVSSYAGAFVRKFNPLGVDSGLFISSNLAGPTNIWFDSNGDLLVSDYNATSVKRFNSSGTFIGNFITGLSQSEGIDFFPNGNILIGNGATASVKMFNSAGTYLQDLIPSGSGNLISPNAIVIRPITGVSVAEQPGQPAIILYPAAGTEFHVLPEYLHQINTISFYDNSGKNAATFNASSLRKSMDVATLADGVYIVKITLKNGNEWVQKVIVKK